jgi:NADH-quinone oxidoreductase subunit J
MIAGSILFAVCALLCVGGAVSVVLAKNPIRGAMGLLTTIVGIAGLFLRLNAEFLAAIQLLVYAGAVVVLFVFVVMLLGPNAHLKDKSLGTAKISRIIAGALIFALGAMAFALFAGGSWHDFETIGTAHGTVEAVGKTIFSAGLVPFELATVLLIVAVVGAISVARTKPSSTKKPFIENPTLRMYHGPLLPRDAEHPLTDKTLAERAAEEKQKESA